MIHKRWKNNLCTTSQLLRAAAQVLTKHAGVAQQNGFGPAFLHKMLRLVKDTAKPTTCC